MQKTYVHPWYLAQQKLASTTNSDAELMQKQAKEPPGKTHIEKQDDDGYGPTRVQAKEN